jgi:AcrR family transcriptional regulator
MSVQASAPRGTAGRAATTRSALLGAAREVFCASGFAEASIAEVVAGARASVGSLYHHFGGKAELYLALFEDYQQRQEARTVEAVRTAVAEGESDPVALFVAGSRAYLHGCWTERDLARLFLAGGGPPGFELVARRRYREWTRRNATLLASGPDDVEPWGDALVLVLTTVISEAGHEVAVCEDEPSAHRLAGDVLELIGRIGRPGDPS